VSVLHIHGTADQNIPIGGGKGRGIAGIAFSPPRDAVTTFARADGCPTDSTTSVSRDNPDVSTETWKHCHDDTAVEFVKVNGASHAWMGHPSSRAGQAAAGAPYMNYDSSAAIWEFLAAHPRRA
jgi:polyhydroxybutyrate depolymerase